MWFTDYANNSIGRITTSGAVTSYSDPGINHPEGIAAGPDGALWFTNDTSPGSIGRITTAGQVTNDFSYAGTAAPLAIVAGPDGAMWFDNESSGSFGRITTTGQVTIYRNGASCHGGVQALGGFPIRGPGTRLHGPADLEASTD